MATVYTEVLPERKSSKRSAINWQPATDNEFSPVAGTLTIHTDRATTRYAVSEFPSGWDGRAFTLVKLGAAPDEGGRDGSYSCFVARNGQDQLCECRGFQSHGHCKHLDSVTAMIAAGWL